MRVLVTGATGFIGGAITRKLALEHRVLAATRRASGIPAVEEVRLDGSSSGDAWRSALEGVGAVVHAAARVHVMRDTASDPIEAFREVNVRWTERVARAAAAAGARRFVYLSSVKVMGEGREAPYTEDDPPAPADAYGVSKFEAEAALQRVATETGLEVVLLRPPLVYGPGVKANFERLLRWVARGVPLPFGAIHNRRSLVYVENLADAVRAAIAAPRAAGAYFVTDGTPLSTPELVRHIAAALGRPARLVHVPTSLLQLGARALGRGAAADRLLSSLSVDGSRLRQALAWTPPFTVDEGLHATATWWKARSGRQLVDP